MLDIEYREAIWFTAVTVSLNCMVFVLCGTLELVERYGLFKHARIQKKVRASYLAVIVAS